MAEEEQQRVTPSIPEVEWTPPSDSYQGSQPNGFRLFGMQFGGRDPRNGAPLVQNLGLGDLIGTDPFTNADAKANHFEPGAVSGMLADTMAKLEQKYHSGVFDAQTMPLVEAYLAELRHFAMIQADRQQLLGERVADVKEANKAAYDALSKVREEREQAIRDQGEYVQNEVRVNRYRKDERKRKRRQSRDTRKLTRDLLYTEWVTARRQRQKEKMRAHEMDVAIAEEARAQEALLSAKEKAAESQMRTARDELRAAEANCEAQSKQEAAAKAACAAAEESYAKALLELEEEKMRLEHIASTEELMRFVKEYQQDLDQITDQVRQSYAEIKAIQDAMDAAKAKQEEEAARAKEAAAKAAEEAARKESAGADGEYGADANGASGEEGEYGPSNSNNDARGSSDADSEGQDS